MSQLLHEQVGVVQFEPYRTLFSHAYARSRTVYTAIPSLPPVFGFPHRNWREAGAKGGSPLVGLTLATLASRLQVGCTLERVM